MLFQAVLPHRDRIGPNQDKPLGILCVILVFLSQPEPSETPYYYTNSNNMLTLVSTLRQLARQVGGSVKCNSDSTVAGAMRLIAGASGTAPNGSVRFLDEFSVAVGAFALGQVLNFGSLAYVADRHNELCPLNGATLVGTKSTAPPPPSGPLGADLEVLGPSLTLSDRH